MSILERSVRALIALLATACLVLPAAHAAVDANPGSPHAFYESAARYFSDDALPEAVIELRNALQRSPGHVPSRILLGRVYLRTGDASAAEKELALALSYGADETLVLGPLGNALLLQRKHEEILKRIRSLNTVFDTSAELLSIRGQALYELGRLEEAEVEFRSATWASPGHVEPLLGLANVLMAQGKREEVEKLVEQAARIDPENAEVWFRKAQSKLSAGDNAGAEQLLDRVLEKRPEHMRARMTRASLRMSLGKLHGARDDADFILFRQPDDPHAALLSAQALVRLGQTEEARGALALVNERLESVDPEFLLRNPAALSLAGKISFVQHNFEKVNYYFTRYLNLRPKSSPLVRKLLARARIEIGDHEGAANVLDPLVRAHPDDVEALVLLGDANLKAKHYLQAAMMLERASELAADNPKIQTRLALSRIGTGRPDEAVTTLESAYTLDPGSLHTGLILAFMQLRRGELQAAARTSSMLESRHPGNPITANLSGVVLRNAGRIDEAREAFFRALADAPDFQPAMFNLAELERRAGNRSGAMAHYTRILELDSNSVRALISLSDLEREEGRIDDAVARLRKANALAPRAIQPSLQLIRHYLGLDKPAEALRLARELANRHPENAMVLEELARCEMATGNRAGAIRILREAAHFAGYAGAALLRIGKSQVVLGDYEGARWTYGKAADTNQHDEANIALVDLLLKSGDQAAALEMTTALLAREPDSAVAHFVHGEALAHAGRLADSAQAYERSLALAPISDAVVGLYEVLVSAGQAQRGLEHLERWVAQFPQDLVVKRALGLAYIASNSTDKALAVHEELREVMPEDPLVLNNLARLYQIKKDPRAREFGEQAVAIAPNWPIALDTLGWIHVTEGRPEDGLPLLRDAHVRAAQNLVIRYHLAATLGELGRSKEAIEQLDFVLATGANVPWIEDVKVLRASLAGP